ncbi:MAG: MOSC domain-containing protein, partial [Actinomycetota bacterium]|nr:MOSC domain-containing protein [Actinomycetota bacterium]
AGPHDIRRFRPNLVFEAAGDDAYPEDGWVGARLLLGASVEATVRKATARCVLITKPQPGLDHDSAIFRELARERAGLLGVYLDPQTSGSIAVGDAVALVA